MSENGRVERAIRYIRDNFFAGRRWKTLDDLNAQADDWCQGISAERRCPGNETITVGTAFEQEQPALLALPDNPFDTREQVEVRARKTPYIRFDLNDYSIPHTFVQKTLSVNADLKQLRILDGADCIAQHTRCFGKGEQIKQEAHINALWLEKTQARLHRGQDRLAQVSPQIPELLAQSIERGHVLKTTVRLLNEYLDLYGREALQRAVAEAIEQQSPYPQAVLQSLERQREEKHQPPPLAVALPDAIRHLSVKTTNTADYDQLYHDAHSDKPDATHHRSINRSKKS